MGPVTKTFTTPNDVWDEYLKVLVIVFYCYYDFIQNFILTDNNAHSILIYR